MSNLVGTGLNQVPTNGMLGGLAYQSPNSASIKDLDLRDLSKIKSEIADTAVDVFVYDTSKDSDGGAWRHRTQHTSWYNETLNTATRGSRKEFPAVAVIVAESDKVTIYDGDDPDLPMWMEFTHSGAGIQATTAKNGVLYWGCSSASSDRTVYFIKDSYYRWWTTSAYTGYFNEPISGRNGTLTGGSGDTQVLVNGTTNDVAMTVLPNAPVDSATGLPVPTIAVATDGGISVIKDDGNVAIINRGASSEYTGSLAFDENNHIVLSWGTADGGYRHISRITDINTTSTNGDGYNNDYFTAYIEGAGNSAAGGTNGVVIVDNTGRNFAVDYDNSAVGGENADDRLVRVVPFNDTNNTAQNLVSFATTSYNTGWMHGDIKGAFLSDTDDTNVTGSEIIDNGTFDSDTTDWSPANGATLTQQNNGNPGGNINVASGPSSNGYASQSNTVVIGKYYTLSFDHYHVNGSAGYVNIGTTTGGSQYVYHQLPTSSSWTSHSFTIKATDTNLFTGFYSRPNGNVRYDNISLREADPDRSVNNNGLQVFGTITKSAVATGAELVAYSGFSASNRLESVQTAIDFGSSPNATICFMSWVNQSTTGEYSYIMSVQDGNSTAPVGMAVDTSTGNFYVYEGTDVKSSSHPIVDGKWHHCVGIINGTSILGYVDGKKVIDTTTSNPPDLSGIDRFHIGHFRSGTTNLYHQRGSLALSRISKSIPSAEQIKKIYEDEKVLFQENAKATLYGSSDAVTALAYDDDTELLYVGTSSGRSNFRGLRRINNTTTAVTTAISASNGLVAEE